MLLKQRKGCPLKVKDVLNYLRTERVNRARGYRMRMPVVFGLETQVISGTESSHVDVQTEDQDVGVCYGNHVTVFEFV